MLEVGLGLGAEKVDDEGALKLHFIKEKRGREGMGRGGSSS